MIFRKINSRTHHLLSSVLLTTTSYFILLYCQRGFDWGVLLPLRFLDLVFWCGICFYALKLRRGALAFLIGFSLFHILESWKIKEFGLPPLFDDLRFLFLLLSESHFGRIIEWLIAGLASVFIYLMRQRIWNLRNLVNAIVIFLLLTLAQLGEIYFSRENGYLRTNSVRIGALVTFTLSLTQSMRDLFESPPSKKEIHDAIEQLPKPLAASVDNLKRDIIIIVLESFFDLSQNVGIPLSEDPLSPWRAWQEKYGRKTFVPTIASGTAASEFEMLCGLPATVLNPIAGYEFGAYIRHALPCLPNLLKKAGYETVVFNPSSYHFFREDRVYPNLGFENIFFADSFPKDDLDEGIISDDTFFKNVKEWLTSHKSNTPRLIYLVTYAGHYPFRLDPQKRPQFILNQKSKQPNQIANRLFYTARAISKFLNFIRTENPSAIVAVFGDHQPISVRDIWKPNKKSMLPEVFETPALLINADAVAGNIGSPFAIYELPSLILRAAGINPPPPFQWTSGRGDNIFRPTVGGNDFYFTPQSTALLGCIDSKTNLCSKLHQTRLAFETLTRALLFSNSNEPLE